MKLGAVIGESDTWRGIKQRADAARYLGIQCIITRGTTTRYELREIARDEPMATAAAHFDPAYLKWRDAWFREFGYSHGM